MDVIAIVGKTAPSQGAIVFKPGQQRNWNLYSSLQTKLNRYTAIPN